MRRGRPRGVSLGWADPTRRGEQGVAQHLRGGGAVAMGTRWPARLRRQRPASPRPSGRFPQPGLRSRPAPPPALAEASLTPHKTSSARERRPSAGPSRRPRAGSRGRDTGSQRKLKPGGSGLGHGHAREGFAAGIQPASSGSGFSGQMYPFAPYCVHIFYFHLVPNI